jgi:hypothetical protein
MKFIIKNKFSVALAAAISLIIIVLAGSIEVSANHITINSNLSVTPNIISFETVFPGEIHFKPLTITLSDEFLESEIHDDVEYKILQRTKPREDSQEEREYCALFPNDYSRCYPSLCPFLSKTADEDPPNDTSIPAFHNPADPTSIVYGRLAKSDEDVVDDWIIDLHTPCFKGQCDQTSNVPPEYQLDPEFEGEIFGCDLIVEIERISFFDKCPLCELDENNKHVVVEVNGPIIIDFSTNPPTYNGDTALLPYFSYDVASSTPTGWKAIFQLGGKTLKMNPGASLKTEWNPKANHKDSPTIIINTDCQILTEDDSLILVESSNRDAGDIILNAGRGIEINGVVRNQQTASQRRPGNINLVSWCGDILIGDTGFIDDKGRHAGARNINILACDAGDIEINGVVWGRASINSPNPKSQPNINVASFEGAVTINSNTPAPLYKQFSYGGAKFDLWAGLFSTIIGHKIPGVIQVQAHDDVTVNSHGIGKNKKGSFGAISTKTRTNAPTGGIIDVRSINGGIVARDRAFDVWARNTKLDFAEIRLYAKESIALIRLGPNDEYNPVVDGSARNSNGVGADNTIRSYQGEIINGADALISATKGGSGGADGLNLLTSCLGVTNNGTIDPSDSNPVDDIGVCADSAPEPIWESCDDFASFITL